MIAIAHESRAWVERKALSHGAARGEEPTTGRTSSSTVERTTAWRQSSNSAESTWIGRRANAGSADRTSTRRGRLRVELLKGRRTPAPSTGATLGHATPARPRVTRASADRTGAIGPRDPGTPTNHTR